MTALINNLLYDPRDLAVVAIMLLASLPAGAWIGFWFRVRPAALADVVERHEGELQALRKLHHIDELTGLQNRRALEDIVLPAAVLNVRETRKPLAVAFADFDDFKLLNAKLGHDGADRVIKAAADRIRRTLAHGRTTDQVFRRNRGDEFVLVLPGADIRHAGRILRDVLADLQTIGVRASIGCVVAHAGNLPSPAELLHQADQEMQRVKLSGKGTVRVVAAVAVAEHDRPGVAIGIRS